MGGLIASFVNLAILMGILVYYLRIPVREMVRLRHEGLRNELELVQKQLAASRGQYEEVSAKLKAVGVEVAALREQVAQDADRLKRGVILSAERSASAIGENAKRGAEGLFRELFLELRRRFAERVISESEALIAGRLTGEVKERIRQKFSVQLEKMQ